MGLDPVVKPKPTKQSKRGPGPFTAFQTDPILFTYSIDDDDFFHSIPFRFHSDRIAGGHGARHPAPASRRPLHQGYLHPDPLNRPTCSLTITGVSSDRSDRLQILLILYLPYTISMERSSILTPDQ